ncbi:MAG: HEAT repeat domain-containing protein [Anaerolineales bacterium]|nr:HEAT repeat domain-containing protein [Anaerolineales bacterium]
MAKQPNKRSSETKIAKIDAALAEGAEEGRRALNAALKLKSPVIVAHAAGRAAAHRMTALLPMLEATSALFFELPAKGDPGCIAKTALVKACDELESTDHALFLKGIACRQPEPIWGGSRDTAGNVRGRSLRALFRLRHPDATGLSAQLLADEDPLTRMHAARALADAVPLAAVPLLRYKVLIGDEETGVTEEAMSSLLALDSEEGVAFLVGLLRSPDERLGDLAAVTLMESKSEQACEALIEWAEDLTDRRVNIAFVSLAALRLPDGIDYLLDQIRSASESRSALAAGALAAYETDPSISARLREAVDARNRG